MSVDEQDNDVPSNHKLAMILSVVSTKLDDVLKNQNDDREARILHESNDSKRFVAVHKKIDGMYKYAAIAVSFGVFVGYFGKEIKQVVFGV